MGSVVEALVGGAASLAAFILWIPQAAAVWAGRRDASRLSGLSVHTQLLLLGNQVLWVVYSVMIGAFWVGAPAIVNIPLAVLTIAVLLRTRRREGPVPEAS